MAPREAGDDILFEASDWFIRLQSQPGDPALRAALAGWIAADPAHGEAWALAERSWALAGELGPEPGLRAAPPPARRPPHRRRLAILGGTALAAGLALAVIGPEALDRADHAAGTANREVLLPDGSSLTLGAGSAIDVAYAPDRREVALRRGDTFLRVVPDEGRPFRLRAGELRVTVTGTEFAVGTSERDFRVAVAEGSVRVELAAAQARLGPGDALRIDRRTGEWQRERIEPAAVAPWRQGRLSVRDEALEEVAASIGRYMPGLLLVRGEALKARRVTGVYDLRDPERALMALMTPFGGNIRRLGPFLTVLEAQ